MKLFSKNTVLALLCLSMFAQSYAQQWQYQVKKGDSLWSIADEYLISPVYVKKLQQFNSVKDPYKLQPGTMIIAPVEWLGNLPGSATVISVIGLAQVSKAGQTSPITEGYKVEANDEIVTGEDGVLVLEFSDESTVRIYANTQLSFKKFKQSFDGSIVKARISIKSGRLKAKVNPEKKPGHRLEIESPAAVTAVRGTEFRIGVEGSSSDTVTEVLTGAVGVSAQGKNIAVGKLFGTKTETGKKPINPVKLLSSPEFETLETYEGKIGKFSWEQLRNAETYRIRVANDEQMNNLVYDQVVFSNQVNDVFFPQDGEFYASVRGIDSNDIEGLDGVAKFNVNARPEPPLIIGPKNESSTFEVNPNFSWAIPADSTTQLHYQLSADPQFQNLIIDEVFDPTDHFTPQSALQPGDYYWRVANMDSAGRGPFSKVSLLSVKKEPELSPELSKTDAGRQVSLTLTHDPSVPRYHAQVSQRSSFEKILHEQWVDGDEFAFNTKESGSYFIRLGIEDKETGEIHYGEAQKIIVPYGGIKQLLISLATGLILIL